MSNEINELNYYSQEMKMRYLSVHGLMDYLDDKAVFWLKIKEAVKSTKTNNLIAGQLFHSFMDSEEAFSNKIREDYNSIFKIPKNVDYQDVISAGLSGQSEFQPKSEFVDVWNFIADNFKNRDKIWDQNKWSHEVILTGKIGGAPFKGKLDALSIEGDTAIIVDYKTISMKEHYGYWWDEDKIRHEKNFLQEYNYDLQLAAYEQLVRQNYPIIKHVKFKMILLVKQGKHKFASYPSGLIHINISENEIYTGRFYDGRTAQDVLSEYSRDAYQLANLKELPANLLGHSPLAVLALKENVVLAPEDIKLK